MMNKVFNMDNVRIAVFVFAVALVAYTFYSKWYGNG